MRGAGERYGNASTPMTIEHKHTNRRVMDELNGQRRRPQRENSWGGRVQRHLEITNSFRFAGAIRRHLSEAECSVERNGVMHFSKRVQPRRAITNAPCFRQRGLDECLAATALA